jgi:plastocyanin
MNRFRTHVGPRALLGATIITRPSQRLAQSSLASIRATQLPPKRETGKFPLVIAAFGCSLACSDGAASKPDASTGSDAAIVAAKVVTCPAAVQFNVGVSGQSYVPPAQTVPAGSIVKFTASIDHSAKSRDNLFTVDFGETTCVQFQKPGAYQFYCTAHGFLGTVTVQ